MDYKIKAIKLLQKINDEKFIERIYIILKRHIDKGA